MYKINYLDAALQDMKNIVIYISHVLNNPDAAMHLANKFVNSAESLSSMPYIHPSYHPIHKLKNEYRKLVVDHFIMFYSINEREQIVTIYRVIYAKRNLLQLEDTFE